MKRYRMSDWLFARQEETRLRHIPRPARKILLGFALIILLGSLLLHIPAASRSGTETDALTCLFTATSATCVTGLVVVDTWSHWSLFGQCIILALIQIGGLGFLSIAAIVSFLLGRRISMRERMEMSAALNMQELSGVIRLTRHVIAATFVLEGVGAAALATRFVPQFGLWEGIYRGIFHSVSAFCNAGFDLMGEKTPFSSLTSYAEDPVVNGTILLLIIVGGLGFYVWGDVAAAICSHRARWQHLTVHTRLVLIVTGILLAAGTLIFYGCERSNPATLGGMNEPQKWMAALFQSVTYRTAGFNTVDLSAARDSTTLASYALMLIGGSPGSTAGGVKTTALAIVVLSMAATLTGKRDVNVFHRRIPPMAVRTAVTLVCLGISISFVSAFVLMAADGIPMQGALFETTSAFATVGLSMGYTSTLSVLSKVCLMLEMYIGRVGILTLGLGLLTPRASEPLYRYPETHIMIG